MSYLVPPGIYALGSPDETSPVIVTANYKMTYDLVRHGLGGRSVWLLVLETYGINVWCAAGKGTFGTGELVRRIESTRLSRVVGHRELILPLLGAAGVKALDVRKRSGFSVRFSVLRAEDLPAYLDAGMVADPAMRQLTFTWYERMVLTPVEIVGTLRSGWPTMAAFTLAAALFTSGSAPLAAATAIGICLLTILTGTVAGPLLLPWLPTRSFAVKGAIAGLVAAVAILPLAKQALPFPAAVLLLAVPAFSSFLTLNFTGSTPFTSRSGVKKEMHYALPLQGAALLAGVIAAFLGGWR